MNARLLRGIEWQYFTDGHVAWDVTQATWKPGKDSCGITLVGKLYTASFNCVSDTL